jgi:hypothetical protein
MNVLAERKRERLIPALILLHADEGVLVRALELLGPSRRQDWHALGERLLDHASPLVQQAAVRAFALSGRVDVLGRLREHPSANLRTFAALYLAQLGGQALPGDPLTWEIFHGDDAEHTLKRAFIEALAAHPTPETPRLLLAFARVPALGGAVTAALQVAGDESSIEFLIGRLKWADDRLVARRAQRRLSQPEQRALDQALWDERIERRVRIHVPRSISPFLSLQALRVLERALVSHRDGLVRYKALRGLEQLALETSLRIEPGLIFDELKRNALEYLRLFSARLCLQGERAGIKRLETELVVELLDDKIAQSRDRLARLLQVLHRGDDIPAIFAALHSSDRRRRGRAVEFLDALIHGFDRASDDAASLLRLVVDDLPDQLRAERAAPLVGAFPDARAALTLLSGDGDEVVSLLSSRALASLGPAPASVSAPGLLQERPA